MNDSGNQTEGTADMVPCAQATGTAPQKRVLPSIEYKPAVAGSHITTIAGYSVGKFRSAAVRADRERALDPVSVTSVCTMLDGEFGEFQPIKEQIAVMEAIPKEVNSNLPYFFTGLMTCNIDICTTENEDCLFLRSNGNVKASYALKYSEREVVVDFKNSYFGDFPATITSGSGSFMGYIGEARVGENGRSIEIAAMGFPMLPSGSDIWSLGEQNSIFAYVQATNELQNAQDVSF